MTCPLVEMRLASVPDVVQLRAQVMPAGTVAAPGALYGACAPATAPLPAPEPMRKH